MSHMPGHLEGALADTWRQLQSEAERQGIDPEDHPVVVTDESRKQALADLALMGGARVEPATGGASNVYLTFDDPPGGHDAEGGDKDHKGESGLPGGVQAAAHPSRFAVQSGQYPL